MKRNHLFNRIISLILIGALYVSMSASAYADTESNDVVETIETTEINNSTDEPDNSSFEIPSGIENYIEGQGSETPVAPESTVVPETPVAPELPEVTETPETPENPKEPTELDDPENPEVSTEPEDPENPEDLENPEEPENPEDPETLEELEEDEEECEHELEYIPNGDGTHTVRCKLCEDFEEYNESCEFDENDTCIKCGYHRLPTPLITYEDDEVIVTVAGAIPENADLKVTPLKPDVEETKEAYEEAETKLQESFENKEARMIGFVAYDICFTDIETGEEKEPEGDVTVSLKYKKAINPARNEDIEKAKSVGVEVMHIDSNTAELENLTETGAAAVATEAGTNVTEASFTNNSFSTYIISWSGEYFETITINLIAKAINGETIEDLNRTTNVTVDRNTPNKEISEIVDEITDYEFVKATYKKNYTETEVTTLDYRSSYGDHYLYLYNGETYIEDFDFWYTPEIDITVYYKKIDNPVDLQIMKYATGDADNDTTTEYVFILKDSEGNIVKGAKYKIDETEFTTNATTGEFNLKTKETAKFYELEEGTYTIIETKNTGETFNLINDFTTKIYVQGVDEPTVFAVKSADERKITVSVTDGGGSNVKFKNCQVKTKVISQQSAVVEKFVEDLKDDGGNPLDDYTITFKFKGPSETVVSTINEKETHNETKNLNVDIIVVIDKSGSMEKIDRGQNRSRVRIVKDAMDSMIDSIAAKEDVNAKWKIIDFASKAEVVSNGWVSTENVKQYVTTNISSNNAGIGRGTNYQAGLDLAQSEMSSRPITEDRPDSQRIVIFLTDGQPTYYYSSGKNLAGSGSHLTEETEEASYQAAARLQTDYFYALGIGLGTIDYYKYSNSLRMYVRTGDTITGTKIIENLVTSNTAPAANKASYNIAISDVSDTLSGLAGTISSITTGAVDDSQESYYATNVTMMDTLSENVAIMPKSIFYINVSKDGKDLDKIPGITVAWTNGQIDANRQMTQAAEYVLPDGAKLTATYNSGKVELEFPDGYVLDDGYEYSVKVWVEPTAAAYDYYYTNKSYPNQGDEGTDHFRNDPVISSEMAGFYTNGIANTEYDFKGSKQTLDFPKPVIPVRFKNVWELYKENGTGKKLEGAEFILTEQATDSTDTATYTGKSAYEEGIEGLVQWNDTVASGKTYKLEETKAPYGYVKSSDYVILTLTEENVPTANLYAADGTLKSEYALTPNREGLNIIKYKFTFVNVDTYTLPETGGNGIYRTTVFGVALMITSAFLFYTNKKKKKVYVKK